MFERFTERAVDAVSEAQNLAKEMHSEEVMPEHLLLALVEEAKGVSLKLFRMYGVTSEAVKTQVQKYVKQTEKKSDTIAFSHSFKDILKHTLDLASKSGNMNILFYLIPKAQICYLYEDYTNHKHKPDLWIRYHEANC